MSSLPRAWRWTFTSSFRVEVHFYPEGRSSNFIHKHIFHHSHLMLYFIMLNLKKRGKINLMTHLLRAPTMSVQLVLAGSQHPGSLGNRLSLVTEFNTSPSLTDIRQHFNYDVNLLLYPTIVCNHHNSIKSEVLLHQSPLKCLYLSSELHVITSKKTII